jgi:putative transposase
MLTITHHLNHSTWDCQYHVVFMPKYRKKALYGMIRRDMKDVFHRQKECVIEAGHLMPDHVHMLLSIPPRYAVSQVIGFIKGKSAIHIAWTYMGRRRNFKGQRFWARGYYVCQLWGTIRAYIQK